MPMHDGLMFGDNLRQNVIWLAGMNINEAYVYAEKTSPKMPVDDIEIFFEQVESHYFLN